MKQKVKEIVKFTDFSPIVIIQSIRFSILNLTLPLQQLCNTFILCFTLAASHLVIHFDSIFALCSNIKY